ncbi:MAG: hypothetical protein J7L23_03310 [Candidatus Diapherotrites archaeon]|nr:hypothetical protein [Candidatus Diapherotrites archaeon]
MNLGFLGDIKNTIDLLFLGFKVVVLVFLVGWVRGHLGGGIIATVAILIIGWLVLFKYFYLFGPMAVIYLILIVGGSGVIMDIAFGRSMYLEEPYIGKDLMDGRRPPPI